MIVQRKIFVWLVIVWNLGGNALVGAINILGVVTSSSRSHNHHASVIFDELANSGHSVTVLSSYQQSQKVNHYQLENVRDRDRVKNHFESDESETLKPYYNGLDRTKSIAADPSFQKLLSSDLNVDVIIFDYDFNEAILGLANVFNCPVILLNTGRLRGLGPRLLGLPYPLRNLMSFLHHSHAGLIKSIENLFLALYEEIFVDFFYHGQQENLYNNIFDGYKIPFHDCYSKSVAKVLINTLSDRPLLLPPDMVDVTGVQIRPNNIFKYSFPEKLDDFIYSTESGCVYVSFGADVNPLTLPRDKINAIFRVLYRRPEKVIWAWNGNTSVFGNSEDFYLDRWLPQSDILRHDNVKLFITSGGQLSLIEAIHHEVPIIGIPLTSEQSASLDVIQSQGLGIKLDLCNVSTASLTWAISEILDNNRFHENLIVKSESIQDQPMTPMNLVKFWVNHVYRHRHDSKNEQRPPPPPLALNYYFLDVYLVFVLILVIAALGIVFSLRFLYNALRHTLARRKLKLY